MNEESEFFTRSAAETTRRIDEKMSLALRASAFSQQEKLARACRALADNAHARTLAGEITLRAEARDTFWTTHVEADLGDTKVSNPVRIDRELRPRKYPEALA